MRFKYKSGPFSFKPLIALYVTALIGSPAWPQSEGWEAEAQKKVDAIIKKNGSGTDLDLQKRLLEMGEEDQAIRYKWIEAPSDKQKEIVPSLEATDRKLTAELKDIFRRYGWPTIQLVGIKASQAAATILNHSPDHDLQRELIPQLSKMVEQDEIVGSDLAYIIDKVLLLEGKPWLLGTVFRFEDESMTMAPVQDPQHLDQRRAQYLLPPMKEYIRMMEELYHKKLK